eukprot:GEMP01029531.1.p1 GENE.GEMP01029531.1~~GEMP01029531.1.p1  ORF type:complete len:296 (-),score=90.89 GEMP01029531.1:1361-2206(-)
MEDACNEVLDAKREFNIQQKEIGRKRKEELKNKERKVLTQENKVKTTTRDNSAVEAQNRYYQELRLRKIQLRVQNELMARHRDTQIDKKHENWMSKSMQNILDLKTARLAEEEEVNVRLMDARKRKNEQNQAEALERADKKHNIHLLEEKRRKNEDAREELRKEKELQRIEALKTAQNIELEQIKEDAEIAPLTVAKKCALVASITECPSVSELLCALKTRKADIDDLRKSDVERRAKLHGLSLFAHVKKLDVEFEAAKFPIPSGAVTFAPKPKNKGPLAA